MCSPAHLHTQLLWLDFPAMQGFEARYWQWLGKKLDRAASAKTGRPAARVPAQHTPAAGVRRV
jgi:hypothetical protein